MTPFGFTKHVLLMRDAGVVKRSHTCRTLLDRNVAEHSHGVAMLALLLYQSIGLPPSGRVLAAALVHDLSEIATGDVPAPVKRDNPELKSALNAISTDWEKARGLRFDLNRNESYLLLWCDRMDFALYALEEVGMGNKLFLPYLNRIVFWLLKMEHPCLPHPDEQHSHVVRRVQAAIELLNAVQSYAEKAIGFPITNEDLHEHF